MTRRWFIAAVAATVTVATACSSDAGQSDAHVGEASGAGVRLVASGKTISGRSWKAVIRSGRSADQWCVELSARDKTGGLESWDACEPVQSVRFRGPLTIDCSTGEGVAWTVLGAGSSVRVAGVSATHRRVALPEGRGTMFLVTMRLTGPSHIATQATGTRAARHTGLPLASEACGAAVSVSTHLG